jgi:hypothetical protein
MVKKKLAVRHRLHQAISFTMYLLKPTRLVMKTVLLALLVITTTLLAGNVIAQIPNTAPIDTIRTRNYSLYLNDGTALYGRIIRRDSSNYTVRLRNGLITYVPLDLLKNLGPGRPKPTETTPDLTTPVVIDTTRKGYYANRFGPYLLFNQTAFNPDAGRMYYRNQYGIINQFDFGLTKFWSIGATVAPITWFLTDQGVVQSFVLQSKITFPIGPWLRLGAGAIYRPGYTQRSDFSSYKVLEQWQLEALATFGDSQRNITFAYGQMFGKGYIKPRPSYVRIGAVMKLAPKLSFVSDNIFSGNDQFGSDAGSQFSGVFRLDRRRHSFDVGVLGLVRDEYSYRPYPSYSSYYPSGGLYPYRERKLYPLPYVGYNLLIKSHKGRP